MDNHIETMVLSRDVSFRVVEMVLDFTNYDLDVLVCLN